MGGGKNAVWFQTCIQNKSRVGGGVVKTSDCGHKHWQIKGGLVPTHEIEETWETHRASTQHTLGYPMPLPIEPPLGVIREQGEWPLRAMGARSKGVCLAYQADLCCLANQNKIENGQRHRVCHPLPRSIVPRGSLMLVNCFCICVSWPRDLTAGRPPQGTDADEFPISVGNWTLSVVKGILPASWLPLTGVHVGP